MDFLTSASAASGFLPQGHCFLWNRDLLILTVLSDALIALAYFSIPGTLLYFVRKRADIELGWIFLLFAGFILASGTTHALDVWTVWKPDYWLSAIFKAVAALASIGTAVLLWILMPWFLALPSPRQLRHAHADLGREIAGRLQTLMALEESEARFRSAFDHAPIGIGLVSPEGRWLKVNRALSDIVGYSEAELLVMDFQSITHADDLETDLAQVRALVEGTRHGYSLEKRYIHKQGQVVWVSLSVSLVRKRDGSPLHLITQIQDVTERKRTEKALRQAHKELEARVTARTRELVETNAKLQREIGARERNEKVIRRYAQKLERSNRQLERLARFDELSGLYNRRYLMELLEKAFLTAQRYRLALGVMMLDLDHFKQLNDTHGHLMGDRVLATVGRLLRENLRASDIVGRYGGEEFCIALSHTSPQAAETTAEKLRTQIMQQRIAGDSGKTLQVTCSIGIAQWQPAMSSIGELLDKADQALYRAKAAGRNRVVVWDRDTPN